MAKGKISWQTYSFGADIFGATAFLLTLFGTFRCNFLQFASTTPGSNVVRNFGLWWYGHMALLSNGLQAWVYEGCFPYPDIIAMDGKWKAARAFQVIVLIGGVIYIVMGCIDSCAMPGKVERPHTIVAACLLFLSLCSGLVLLALDSVLCKDNVLLQETSVFDFNDTCELAVGANCVISATVFWFAAALCTLMASRSKSDDDLDELVENGTTEPLIQEGV